jgi:hypothetical protein
LIVKRTSSPFNLLPSPSSLLSSLLSFIIFSHCHFFFCCPWRTIEVLLPKKGLLHASTGLDCANKNLLGEPPTKKNANVITSPGVIGRS